MQIPIDVLCTFMHLRNTSIAFIDEPKTKNIDLNKTFQRAMNEIIYFCWTNGNLIVTADCGDLSLFGTINPEINVNRTSTQASASYRNIHQIVLTFTMISQDSDESFTIGIYENYFICFKVFEIFY